MLTISKVTRIFARASALAVILGAATAIPGATSEKDPLPLFLFSFKVIDWSTIDARAMLEADFRRAVAEQDLNVSSAEVAGAAAQAASGVTHIDNWPVQKIIRGCGPAKEFCFVITCNRCSRGK